MSLPSWATEVVARYESGAAGQFILHGNVADRMLLRLPEGPRLGRLNDYLLDVLLPRFQVVLTYDPGFGLRVERGQEIFADWPALREIGELPSLPLPAIRAIARFLQYARNLRAVGAKPVTVAVVLRDAQLYVPVLPQTMNHELSAIASLIRSWGGDTSLAAHGQAIFLVADRIHSLHPLVANNPRAAEIELPLPDTAELAGALAVLAPECPRALAADADFTRIASRLAGTSIAALEAFLRRRNHAGTPLADADLGDLRKALVERDAGELIDFIEPDRSLDDVIGLEGVKTRLRQDLALWKQDEVAALPMGYLFCGPVGTGKTYLAECLAGEAGVPVVTLRNFRDRWVGSTEANLEKIFALLHALGRCIVFIDEADQALGRRASGSGDSGVSSRVYSMLAAEMSDTRNRGRILWVLASSRPDLIEVDLKRPGRIDVKVPIFPTATAAEGMVLLGALCKRRGIPLDDEAKAALLPLVPQWLTPGAAEALAVKAYRLTKTGTPSPQEALHACLQGYLPPVDPLVIKAQMRLASEEATDAEFVPVEVRSYLDAS
ncbi:ATP-binding protein [Luteolibacter flavescens]|uniref:ATP-binding protein n=1 Tax=Luteolibacter flavescens TaxID=1859460 RepID=A0ABT3FPG6_9BACT|nr:ATP-binding protein [Luteolibacter flavescens]MCW1885109.1 ATP-binding protein [Luteolibacter flavescens]